MICNIALFMFLLIPSLSMAQLNSEFVFNGQNAVVLEAKKNITIIIPEVVQVPHTCTRQVSVGESEVCRNETRYRQECSWIPSSERCWNESDRICRPVSRTRQECSNGPSRQVCTTRPSRRVCTQRPTRNVCTTRPDGRQHCTTVGGGESCQDVGGGQSCHSVPGERTCRTVSYTEQRCENVSRHRCEHVPGRNDCRDIPYSQRVCTMEMQYRTESYACTRPETINRTTHKVLKNEINVQILSNGLVEEFPVSITVIEANQQFKNFSIDIKLGREPLVFVVLKKKSVKIACETEKEIILKSEVVLEVLSQEMLPIAFPAAISSASVDATKQLIVVLDGSIAGHGAVELEINHKAFLRRTKTIAELKAHYPGDKIELGQVEDKIALSIDLNDAMKNGLESKNMILKFKLSSELNLQGELMNAKKPDTSKLYDGTFVKLK